jgi:dipeptidyl aminopeptidase/acylaminoacyl peptidase
MHAFASSSCKAAALLFAAFFISAACADPLPLETFFRKPAYADATLSPSGRYLAVIAPIGGQKGLAVLDLDTRKTTAMKSPGDGDILRVAWQNDERLVVVIGDLQRASGEPPRESGLVAVNRDGSDSRVIAGAAPRLVGGSNIVEKSFERPWYVRKSADDRWVKVDEAKLGRLASEPLEFDPDGKLLYVSARRDGADRASLYEYAVDTGAWKNRIVSHPVRDIDADTAFFRTDYKARKLLGLRYRDDRPAAAWFDAQWARMQKSVDAALPDTVNLLQRGGERWLVVAMSDRDPGDAYLLDAKTMRLEKLFSFEPWIDPKAMAAERWVSYRARDGMTIPALLTVPEGPGKRLPLVVLIHGGPYVEATQWGYDAEAQFLASRGYAVLQPQFRGTRGYGWKLHSSGFRQWGDAMQDDLADGVKWAVEQGIADADRVCFYGASYGGYAAAYATIRNAKEIRCAVAYVGVTSIDYLFDNAQTDVSRLAQKSTLMVEEIGDPKSERARFARVKPLDNADKVGVPILLAYGAADRRVPIVHGTDFRAALDRAHKEYEWVVYADEGHGFAKDANLVDFYGRVERFLAKHLAARPAPEHH